MKQIQLRYNTACEDDFLCWRLLIDGIEHLASHVQINVPVKTIKHHVEGVGVKHSIACESNDITWNDKKEVIIN